MDIKRFFLLPVLVLLSASAYSQLNPMGSMYYQNQYLSNPAMAGLESGFELNGGYKAQWTNVEGSPTIQTVTAAYGTENKKVGLGLSFYNDKAGLIQRTSVKGTYAYHLPLNNGNSFLDFGLSAGVTNEWIDFSLFKGNMGDQAFNNFNDRKLYFDGDFGLAFRNERITLQAALPNLKRFFNRDVERNMIDQSLYFAAASYRFINTSGALAIVEPKISYRGIKNYKGIFDLGINTQFWGDNLILNGIYHTTNSVTIGAGTTFKKQLSLLLMYTTNTGDVQNYSNGEFEVGLKYNFR
ncbi:PorP/SprF family type IX secretion system membrane protein [Pedobacter nototheniae]|uniref:PorP/SprF family type IX secretion system membrane protein n=1 Tax=Pedobacter nototheniae TaxID=2488994 RepID=UPI00292FCD80|nr:PorP/SprF family type IX secretion system membrane protein [Pedobacter nototheniae]